MGSGTPEEGPSTAHSAQDSFPAQPAQHDFSRLSPRQMEVYRWICEGKRDREIAAILGISYRTVTEHVRAILAKLGVRNRVSAAMLAVRGESAGEPGIGTGEPDIGIVEEKMSSESSE